MTPQELDAIRARDAAPPSLKSRQRPELETSYRIARRDRRALLAEVDRLRGIIDGILADYSLETHHLAQQRDRFLPVIEAAKALLCSGGADTFTPEADAAWDVLRDAIEKYEAGR